MQSGLFSAVTSAFIIDIQSELSPDYEQMNNGLLEMLLNATTGNLSPNSAPSITRWPGPDPVIVQVQCIFYATLSATLLAAFLAMLGKQWLSRYKQNETRGSIADRSRLRERKLTGIETWKFHVVMEALPLILQFALLLFGFALSRYLWVVNRSVSSVAIGFTCLGLLFFILIVTASVFSFDCPFQTPFSLLVRFLIGLAAPHLRDLRKRLRSTPRLPPPGTQHSRFNALLPINTAHPGRELEASITALACIAPAAVQFHWSITPLFVQEQDLEGERFDARCVDRLFEMSTDVDAVASTMDFIPEIIWHSGIKKVPLRRIYDALMDCFYFSGSHPVVIPKSREIAYLSAKAFVHIQLQRRCITHYEEHKEDSWRALCLDHSPLSSMDYGSDSDLASALFMVDMTIGCGNGFSWNQSDMTLRHRAWISHVLLYHVWHEGRVSEVVVDFVETSLSLRLEELSDAVITDCCLIIGLMIGVPFHVNDITVKDKRLDPNSLRMLSIDSSQPSREMKSIVKNIFRTFTVIFSSKSMQMPSALRALRLATRLSTFTDSSYGLFKAIMASGSLTDQQWEASRMALQEAFIGDWDPSEIGEPKELLRFLDHHVYLQGIGESHGPSISAAAYALTENFRETLERDVDFDWTSPSFVRGIRSVMRPHNPVLDRRHTAELIALISGKWFNSPVPIMEPEDMSEFSEHVTKFMDEAIHKPITKRMGVTIIFGMLCSPEWRKHIKYRFWSVLAYCALVHELESVGWCLQNALELLEFTRGLADSEGLKWWCWTLWFYYDKLDTTTRDEVKKIAVDMLNKDGLSDLNFYLSLIKEEIGRVRQQVEKLPDADELGNRGRKLRSRLIALEGNYYQLAQITGRSQ